MWFCLWPNIITVADHGFSTISKESQTSSTVKTKFVDTPEGQLPLGFVALDLAQTLKEPLIDPDDNYKTILEGQHPKHGNGLIGGNSNNPKVVVAANSGSDLIYLPDGDRVMAKRVIDVLLAQDYVSGIFVELEARQISGHFKSQRDRARRQRRYPASGDCHQLSLL